MAVLLTGQGITVGVDISDTRSAVAGAARGSGARKYVQSYAWPIVSGIATGSIDRVWADSQTALTAATNTLDLATGGTLTDEFGVAVVFVKLRGIVFVANGLVGVPNTTTLTLGRPAANGVPWITAVSSGPPAFSAGGLYAWADGVGVTVTAATADLITVINSAGASAGYDIYFIGTSA